MRKDTEKWKTLHLAAKTSQRGLTKVVLKHAIHWVIRFHNTCIYNRQSQKEVSSRKKMNEDNSRILLLKINMY